MKAVEFGKENTRKIVLIPGNMMSWRQFERLIPLLEKDYHVIAVSTDGYDGTGETTFTTSEASAKKLEAYIRDNLDGHISRFTTPRGFSISRWEMKYNEDTSAEGRVGNGVRLLFCQGDEHRMGYLREKRSS